MSDTPELTPELLIRAYGAGLFPMAEHRDDPDLFWVDPRLRGIFPLDAFHISRSLRKRLLKQDYRVAINENFAAVVDGCAAREETWINARIHELYLRLHEIGVAHSLEVYRDEQLIGGVYGVTIGAAFFGESMFSAERDGSKIALAYLVDRLNVAGFQLFDTQFLTTHLATLGAIEISRNEYHRRLEKAIEGQADFLAPSPVASAQDVLQRNTQTS